jgi:hypothetical protein
MASTSSMRRSEPLVICSSSPCGRRSLLPLPPLSPRPLPPQVAHSAPSSSVPQPSQSGAFALVGVRCCPAAAPCVVQMPLVGCISRVFCGAADIAIKDSESGLVAFGAAHTPRVYDTECAAVGVPETARIGEARCPAEIQSGRDHHGQRAALRQDRGDGGQPSRSVVWTRRLTPSRRVEPSASRASRLLNCRPERSKYWS